MPLNNLFSLILKGSDKSGNFGHKGRPGVKGGSGSGFGTGKIVSSIPLATGMNEPELVTFENGGQAIWKPYSGNDSVAEVAAYEVSKKLGIEVPETKFYLDKPGTIQKFVEGKTGSELAWSENLETTKSPEGLKIAVFDYVIGNVDRHDGNWIKQSDGKLVAIDNGSSFTNTYVKSNFLEAHKGSEIPKPLVSKLSKLDDKFVDSLFENMRPNKKLGNNVSVDDMKQGMKDRISLLKSTGKLPKVL
jgi:hypothetical protein